VECLLKKQKFIIPLLKREKLELNVFNNLLTLIWWDNDIK